VRLRGNVCTGTLVPAPPGSSVSGRVAAHSSGSRQRILPRVQVEGAAIYVTSYGSVVLNSCTLRGFRLSVRDEP
jgi:hypothetical protein